MSFFWLALEESGYVRLVQVRPVYVTLRQVVRGYIRL